MTCDILLKKKTWSYHNAQASSSSSSTFSMKSWGCSGVRRRSASCRSWSPWISLIITFSRCCYCHRRPPHCHHSRLLHHRWSSWTSLIVSFSRCHHPNLSLPCFIVLVFIIISGYQGRANFSSVRILVVGGGENLKYNHRNSLQSWYWIIMMMIHKILKMRPRIFRDWGVHTLSCLSTSAICFSRGDYGIEYYACRLLLAPSGALIAIPTY